MFGLINEQGDFMAISPKTIEEVQKTANVYDVISDYIPLKRSGANYIALCPFHSEKTPSFVVSPVKNIFKCFGCGISGDAVKFVMEYEKLSFSEAIIKLAAKYGIKIVYTGSDKQRQLAPIFEMTQKVAKFYTDSLIHSQQAKEYLTFRGISATAIKHFELGYSPTDSKHLLEFCREQGIQTEKLVEIGLLSDYKNGKVVDKFAGRIIFPIRDIKGSLVAFGGRAIHPKQSPKYLNSPESQIYHKGKVLYGLFNNLEYIKEKSSVVVVEGYMDVISLWQIGIKNSVATLGTALTPEHAKLLVKYSKDVYLMFDSDEAGKKASLQAAKTIISQGVVPKLAVYEGYKDPDELSKSGLKAVTQVLNSSQDIILYIVSQIQATSEISDREQRLKRYISLYKILLELIVSINIPEILYSYTNLITSELGIPIEKLQKDINSLPKRDTKPSNHTENTNHLDSLSINEKAILKTAIQKPYLLKNCDFCDKIYISPILKYYFELILSDRLDEYDEVSQIVNHIEHAVPEEEFYQELIRIHQKREMMLEREPLEFSFMSEEEKLAVLNKKILSRKNYLKGGIR